MKYLEDRTALWASSLILIAAIALSGLFLKNVHDARERLEDSRPELKGGTMLREQRKIYYDRIKEIDQAVRELDTKTGLFASMVVLNIVAALSGFSVPQASVSRFNSSGTATTLGLVSALLAFGVYWVYIPEGEGLSRTAAFFNLVCGILTAYSSTVMTVKSNDGNGGERNAHNMNIVQGNGQTAHSSHGYAVSQGVPITVP